MTIFGIADSFKTMNRPDPTVTLFDGLFIRKYTDFELWISKTPKKLFSLPKNGSKIRKI